MAGKTIQAAGGIVVRNGARALIAVVQRSKDERWVLPRGKLKRDENPVAGARREVVEETGHRVRVHEFLGAITYRSGGRPKIVLFWHMHADKEPSHEVMADIVAVEWLPLAAAVRRLSFPLEKLFLRNIGRQAVLRHRRRAGGKLHKSARKKTGKKKIKKASKTTSKKASKKSIKSAGKTASKTAGKTERKTERKTASRASSHQIKPAAPTRARNAALRAGKTEARTLNSIVNQNTGAITTVAAKRKSILRRMLGRLAG